MTVWDEAKERLRGRGALALEFYVVQTVPNGDPDAIAQNMAEHLAYQNALEAEGTLFLAGPLSDAAGTGKEGAGMIIYRAASMEDAEAIARKDPMHRSGARSFTIRKWLVNEGSAQISVKLGSQTATMQ